MEQPVEGSILDALKSIFNRLFKDIMGGFEEGGYSKDKEVEIDLNKKENAPKDEKIRKAVDSIDPENRKGMKQTFKPKSNPSKHSNYEVKYYDLSEAKGYEGFIAVEVYDAKSKELIKSFIAKESEVKKKLKQIIDELMKAEAAKDSEVAETSEDETKEDVSSSTKRINFTLRKITASTYVDYQLSNMSSNYPIALVKDDIPTILNLEDLYSQAHEGDNNISVEVNDDSFTITNMRSETLGNNEHILQRFFDQTLDIYRFAYSYYFTHKQDKYIEQVMLLMKDLLDQIASDLADEGIVVKFNAPLTFDKLEDLEKQYAQISDWVNEYIQIYNEVICLVLSLDAQETYDMFVRQLNFINTNKD